MASIRALAPVVLLVSCLLGGSLLGGCDQTPDAPAPTPSARAGFGGPAVRDVDEAMFRTPSKNIFCSLTPSAVRCDIAQKNWKPPAKPADCDLDWGNGFYIDRGAAGVTCTGDTLLNTATETLEYGNTIRSGTVRCTSDSTGLTCKDTETSRGFTMAIARYSLF